MSRWINEEWLKELYKPYESYNGKELAVPIGAILANIDDAPSIDISTWIPCSERLPSESGRYLCTYAEIQRGEYISGIDFGSFINGEWYTSGVIAWMPLPNSYDEREGE